MRLFSRKKEKREDVIDLGYNKIDNYSEILSKHYLVAYVTDEMLETFVKWRRREIRSEVLDVVRKLYESLITQKKRFRSYKGITLITDKPLNYEEISAVKGLLIMYSPLFDCLFTRYPIRIVSKKELEDRGIDYQRLSTSSCKKLKTFAFDI
jgi:hypothetical protein